MAIDLLVWLRQQFQTYAFDVAGVFHRAGAHDWSLTATDAADLEKKLAAGGHLLPLPKEPAALANVLEVSVVDFLLKAADAVPGVEVRRGTERGYPDVEFLRRRTRRRIPRGRCKSRTPGRRRRRATN